MWSCFVERISLSRRTSGPVEAYAQAPVVVQPLAGVRDAIVRLGVHGRFGVTLAKEPISLDRSGIT